jgi:hypothetical protein
VERLQSPYCAIIRAHAADALGNLMAKDADAISGLKTVFTADKHYLVRSWAARALGKLGLVDTLEILMNHTHDEKNIAVKMEAYKAVRLICERSDAKVVPEAFEFLSEAKKLMELEADREPQVIQIKNHLERLERKMQPLPDKIDP